MSADATPSGGNTVAVALANPATVEQLMRTAADLAASNDGEVLAISVVHKPPSSPFLLFEDDRIKTEFADVQQAILERAVAAGERRSVPVRRDLRVGRDVAGTILDAAAGADALLLGWHERSRPAAVILGTTVDPVVRRAPCDVYVERVGTTADGVDRILLPTAGGPHDEAAADLARAVAVANDATVSVVSYVEGDPAAAREHVDAAVRRLRGVPVEHAVRETDATADAIVSAAAGHDLVVLGATRERHLRARIVGSVARSVGRRVDRPVVIARRRSERSLLDRTLGRLWR